MVNEIYWLCFSGGGNQCDVASIDAVQVSDSHMIDGTDPVAVLASVAANTSNVSQLQISQPFAPMHPAPFSMPKLNNLR